MQPQIVYVLQSILLLLISLSPIIQTIESYAPQNNLSFWCKQTPHSDQCEYYLLRQNKSNLPTIDKTHFLNMMVESAMENAMQAHQNAYSLNTNYGDESDGSEKAAWRDCLELHELAIEHLNKTITNPRCTTDDKQTWLSSALTLYQTCQNGFYELNVTKSNITPMLSVNANVSSLISNALAINNNFGQVLGNGTTPAWTTTAATNEDRFPDWVKPGDRRLLQSSSSASRANLVVAQDGSGDFRSIGQAISAASSRNKGGGRFVIYIKTGTYRENVEIGSGLKNVMLLGDGMGKTIITGSKSVGGGTTTFSSATLAAVGDGFMAQGITFRNTAGPANHQAVALRSNSDLSVFYKCSFEGFQDTLYVFSNRQFYRECNIYGTIDYIFGDAAAVLQNCNILVRRSPSGTCTLTAQGRSDPNQNTGIVIHNSRVSAAEGLNGQRVYLGRPWQKNSRTVFMKTYMDSIIDPRGWLEWSGNFALSTLYYAEYANTGPGSSTSNRVNWPGYHVISSAEAGKFSVGSFIGGNSWLPSTGVPYTSGV